MVRSKNVTVSFSSESSIEEELKRESTADAITIVVGFSFPIFFFSVRKFCFSYTFWNISELIYNETLDCPQWMCFFFFLFPLYYI